MNKEVLSKNTQGIEELSINNLDDVSGRFFGIAICIVGGAALLGAGYALNQD